MKSEKEIAKVKLERKQSVISPIYRVQSALPSMIKEKIKARIDSGKSKSSVITLNANLPNSNPSHNRPKTGKVFINGNKQPNEEILTKYNNLFSKDKLLKKTVKGKLMNLTNKNVIINFKEFDPEVS
jgi:hypothetical protein